MSTKKDRGKKEPVTLDKPHRHGGELHPKGATIHVFPDQRSRLEKRGKIAGKAATKKAEA
ncbi:MAG: DUF7210 family protein [Polyangiales bacterium]